MLPAITTRPPKIATKQKRWNLVLCSGVIGLFVPPILAASTAYQKYRPPEPSHGHPHLGRCFAIRRFYGPRRSRAAYLPEFESPYIGLRHTRALSFRPHRPNTEKLFGLLPSLLPAVKCFSWFLLLFLRIPNLQRLVRWSRTRSRRTSRYSSASRFSKRFVGRILHDRNTGNFRSG